MKESKMDVVAILYFSTIRVTVIFLVVVGSHQVLFRFDKSFFTDFNALHILYFFLVPSKSWQKTKSTWILSYIHYLIITRVHSTWLVVRVQNWFGEILLLVQTRAERNTIIEKMEVTQKATYGGVFCSHTAITMKKCLASFQNDADCKHQN